MCGHSMVSPNLARKMLDWSARGAGRPSRPRPTLGRFCSCGMFNPTRAIRLLEAARGGRR